MPICQDGSTPACILVAPFHLGRGAKTSWAVDKQPVENTADAIFLATPLLLPVPWKTLDAYVPATDSCGQMRDVQFLGSCGS